MGVKEFFGMTEEEAQKFDTVVKELRIELFDKKRINEVSLKMNSSGTRQSIRSLQFFMV